MHGTPVVGVSKLCGVEQTPPPIFDRAAMAHISSCSSFKVGIPLRVKSVDFVAKFLNGVAIENYYFVASSGTKFVILTKIFNAPNLAMYRVKIISELNNERMTKVA